jgi:hypothetical protein
MLTRMPAQRDFEERLRQQLVDLDASIGRNFDKLLAQHLDLAAASIRRSNADAQERLEGGLLDLAGVVLRLEAKLDSLAGVAHHGPPESMLQQRWKVSAGMGSPVPVEKCAWGNEHDGMLFKIKRHSDTERISSSHPGQKLGENGARQASTRSLIDIIDKVCAGELPATATGSGTLRKSHPTPVLHQICCRPDSFPTPAKQRAEENTLKIKRSKEASLTLYKMQRHMAEVGKTQEPIKGKDGTLKQGKSEFSQELRGLGALDLSLDQKEGGNKIQHPVELEMSSEADPLPKEDMLDTAKLTWDVDRKLDALSESMSRKLERIAYALGIRNLNVVDNSADDAEDRKRLMEKLKSAFDHDRLKRFRNAGTERERWLEYVFGICKADQRIGKRGSRSFHLSASDIMMILGSVSLCSGEIGRSLTCCCCCRLIHPKSRFAKGGK